MTDNYVYGLTARNPMGRIIEMTFYEPVNESAIPSPYRVPIELAQFLVEVIDDFIQQNVDKAVENNALLNKNELNIVLSDLATWGIYPVGTVVVSDNLGEYLAGHVVNSSRVATVGRSKFGKLETDLGVLAHELGHLAGCGNATQWNILFDDKTREVKAIDCIESGWRHQPYRISRDNDGQWKSDLNSTPIFGHFFEEATAEIVSLQWQWSNDWMLGSNPVVFQVSDRVFEIPVEYDQLVVAWAMLALEKRCPGLVETLLDGARNNHDYDRLKSLIDQVSPTLFDKLHNIRPGDMLAEGAAYVIDCL